VTSGSLMSGHWILKQWALRKCRWLFTNRQGSPWRSKLLSMNASAIPGTRNSSVADRLRSQVADWAWPPCWQEYASVGPDDTLFVWLHADLRPRAGDKSTVGHSQCLGALHTGYHFHHHCQNPTVLGIQFCLIALLATSLHLWVNRWSTVSSHWFALLH
jgi:hypothetical protein